MDSRLPLVPGDGPAVTQAHAETAVILTSVGEARATLVP